MCTCVQSDLFHVRTAIRCGEPVESYYYNPKKGATTGGRIRTTDICALCCSSDGLVSVNQIQNERYVGGKVPLPICRFCTDLNVNIPCSAGRRTNHFKKNSQQKKRKENEMKKLVSNKKNINIKIYFRLHH